jgi:hypothetical protein
MYKKLLAIALSSGLGLCASIPSAVAGVTLFKNYTHGTPISSFTTGYYDCSNEQQKGRCVDKVDFLGEKFTVALLFRDSFLDQVALIAPYKQSLYPTVSDALAKSFNIISLENTQSFLDMVTLRNTVTQDEYVKQFMAFESSALATGDLTYSYLEVPETVGYRDVQGILAAAPEDVRRAAIRIVSEHGSASLVLTFDLPNVNYKYVAQQAEKF